MSKILLHLEGLTVLVISLYIYNELDFSWIMFIILLLAPDLGMLGYLINPKIGSVIYNLCHTYLTPALLLGVALIFSSSFMLAISIIWVAHIGMDRGIGYGLKYPSSFKDSHLTRV
ncbi:DUF4260 domain-containing protein [Piscibacillus salipiscarius]|uniref:DUF4260 domain-containing protein n=1 Tax=Piscibacillus salipiscarius TaxID=299480 RepID=A0ABW5Q9U7_9BACI